MAFRPVASGISLDRTVVGVCVVLEASLFPVEQAERTCRPNRSSRTVRAASSRAIRLQTHAGTLPAALLCCRLAAGGMRATDTYLGSLSSYWLVSIPP